jgi:hypothetical protein
MTYQQSAISVQLGMAGDAPTKGDPGEFALITKRCCAKGKLTADS